MSRRRIVKVQLSLRTSELCQQVLIYPRSRKDAYQGDATPEIVEMMNGELKAFFYAKIKRDHFELEERAPWQDW